jgi:hypothetical protein
MDKDKASAMAAKNDVFRGEGFGIRVTPGALALTIKSKIGLKELLDVVRDYSDFSEANDPYGEHDFGSFDWSGEQLFWKIDYYDPELKRYADPLSDECTRVLTICWPESTS